jgi:hypothetical protein
MLASGKLPRPDLHVGRMPRWQAATIRTWIASGNRTSTRTTWKEANSMSSLRKRGEVWYFTYIQADGRKCERKGCVDKRSTEEMARDAESQATKIKAGLVEPKDTAYRDHQACPLAEQVEGWADALRP